MAKFPKNFILFVTIFLSFSFFFSCTSQEDPKVVRREKSPRLSVVEIQKKLGQDPAMTKENTIELVEAIKNNEIDYAFGYKSVAQQNDLLYIEFPKALNFGDETYDKYYQRARIKIDEDSSKRGRSILFSLTILKNAQQSDLALEFAKVMLNQEGKKVLQENGQKPLAKALSDNPDELPPELRGFTQEENHQARIDPEKDGAVKLHLAFDTSMAQTIEDLENIFRKHFPSVKLIKTSMGARQLLQGMKARQEKPDLIIVNDESLVAKYLYPVDADIGMLAFSSDELVLMYDPKSRLQKEIIGDNWWKIVASDGVRYGMVDSQKDPLGYQTRQLLQLASKYYAIRPENRPASVQKFLNHVEKPHLSLIVNDKVFKSFNKTETKGIFSSNFTVPGQPGSKGASLKEFFEKMDLHLNLDDEIYVAGRGDATVTYGQALQDDMGFVLTRKGTPKFGSKSGQFTTRKSMIAHVNVIKVNQKSK